MGEGWKPKHILELSRSRSQREGLAPWGVKDGHPRPTRFPEIGNDS